MFSADVAELIFKTSLHTRLIHLEDVYVGLCLRKLGVHSLPEQWLQPLEDGVQSVPVPSRHHRPPDLTGGDAPHLE